MQCNCPQLPHLLLPKHLRHRLHATAWAGERCACACAALIKIEQPMLVHKLSQRPNGPFTSHMPWGYLGIDSAVVLFLAPCGLYAHVHLWHHGACTRTSQVGAAFCTLARVMVRRGRVSGFARVGLRAWFSGNGACRSLWSGGRNWVSPRSSTVLCRTSHCPLRCTCCPLRKRNYRNYQVMIWRKTTSYGRHSQGNDSQVSPHHRCSPFSQENTQL